MDRDNIYEAKENERATTSPVTRPSKVAVSAGSPFITNPVAAVRFSHGRANSTMILLRDACPSRAKRANSTKWMTGCAKDGVGDTAAAARHQAIASI